MSVFRLTQQWLLSERQLQSMLLWLFLDRSRLIGKMLDTPMMCDEWNRLLCTSTLTQRQKKQL